MKKLLLFAIISLFLTGCGTYSLVTATFTVAPEDSAVFAPENLSPFFRNHHFGELHISKEDHVSLYKERRFVTRYVIYWDRGNKEYYIIGQIAKDKPNQLLLMGHEPEKFGMDVLMKELKSLLEEQNIKYDCSITTENLKKISVFMRNHSAADPKTR